MDRAAINDLFAYTSWAWIQITAAARSAGDDVLSRLAPGSGWPALRNCLGHIVLGYERWLPAIIELKTHPLPDLPDDAFRTWDHLENSRTKVRDRLKAFLDGVSDGDLYELHQVDVDGESIRYSRAELSTHLLLHERGHHGDVTTLFYQLGLDAETLLEYRFHLQRH